ncbi:MAG TPA: RluA family pseudouridine synthase [Candidatus Methylomirabilis sp.]|nr:RluA family pseudouridine synthase [Candidatus Methylomirabilis sp.]
MAGENTHDFVVEESAAGERLDRYLAARVPQLSRTRIQELIDAKRVTVERHATKGAHRLRTGERIEVEITTRPPMRAEAEAIPLEILYEDSDVIAVNKPAGMMVHAGAGNARGTLVNALLGRGQSLSHGGDALRPGIVHRLDKETSGVILVAKNDFAHAKLAEAFQKRAVKKTYLALVEGRMKEQQGRIELAIGRDLKRRTRMAARRSKTRDGTAHKNAREARTDWRTLAEIDGTTLAEVQPHTGRTHQIRVHFSAMRHPVVGDTLYGAIRELRMDNGRTGSRTRRPDGATMPALGRNFLHAVRLGFAQPRTGVWTEVRAPLPHELSDFLRALAAASGADVARIDAVLAPYL